MTFWQFVEQVPDAEPDWPRRFDRTARLYAVLRNDDDGDLGFWRPFATYIPDGLAELEGRPMIATADRVRAQREWAAIEPLFSSRATFESQFPDIDVQPIHGDAPYYNMISTPHGELWSDLELVTMGPAESDLALADPEGVVAYDEASTRLGRRPLDKGVLRVTEAAGLLAVVASLALAPELPMLVEGLKPVVAQWRATAPISEI